MITSYNYGMPVTENRNQTSDAMPVCLSARWSLCQFNPGILKNDLRHLELESSCPMDKMFSEKPLLGWILFSVGAYFNMTMLMKIE